MVGETVWHARYGQGRISEYRPPYLTVRFQDGLERRFAYPTAFERFLRFENPAFQGRAAVDLSAAKQDTARQEDARAQARLARELELQAARTAELKAKRANSARNAATTRAANKKAAAKD